MNVEILVEQQRLVAHVAAILQAAFPMPVAADYVASKSQHSPAPISILIATLDQLVAAGAASTAPRIDGERCWLWWPSGAARAQERRLR